jgi:hypothetical protein
MAVGKEAEAGTAITGGPLVARETTLAYMIPERTAKGLLVQDILNVSLNEGEGILCIPCPHGGIEGLAPFACSLDGVLPSQNVSDGVGRDLQLLGLFEEDG